MAYNPKTYNLLHSTDLSNALEKAVNHLDNSDSDEPCIYLRHDKPFALKMRLYRYVKAYRTQMKSKDDVDEMRYDHLVFDIKNDCVRITSSLETKSFDMTDEEGNKL